MSRSLASALLGAWLLLTGVIELAAHGHPDGLHHEADCAHESQAGPASRQARGAEVTPSPVLKPVAPCHPCGRTLLTLAPTLMRAASSLPSTGADRLLLASAPARRDAGALRLRGPPVSV